MRLKSTLLAALALLSPATAQSWDQHIDVEVADTRLSSGLAIGPGVIAFGQPRFDPYLSPLIEDVVRVFEGAPGSYVEVASFTSSLPGNTAASFGRELALDGEWLAVGDRASAAVHMYQRVGGVWTLAEVVPQPAFGLFPNSFGQSLDLEGTRLVVGAPALTVPGNGLEDGAVFVFELGPGGWTNTETLVHPAGLSSLGFGSGVELDGERLLVGCPGEPGPGGSPLGAGALHLYERVAGSHAFAATLQAAVPVAGAWLGSSVALEGNTCAAGAIGEEVNGEFGAGRAYVFEENVGSWTQAAVLEQTPLRAYHRFGDDVEIADGALFVTAAGASSAERFERGPNGWAAAQRYTTVAGVTWPTNMPVRVRIRGGEVVLTDPFGATVFAYDPLANVRAGCPGQPLPGWFPTYLDLRSELRLSEPQTRFLAFGVPQNEFGMLVYGFSAASTPLGTGELCVGAPLARAALGTSLGSTLTEIVLDMTSYPVATGPLTIPPGTEVHFQYWFRLGAGNSHLTNSLIASFRP